MEPTSAPAHAALASAILDREAGRHELAIVTLRLWIGSNPGDADALAVLAQCLLAANRDAEAAKVLEAAQAVGDHHPGLLRNQARLLLKSGQAGVALPIAQRAYDLEPGDAESAHVLAVTQANLGQFDQAAAGIEAALALRPAYAEALGTRAQLRARAGDVAGAIADLEAGVAAKPHLTNQLTMLAALRGQVGDLAGAASALEQALAYEPDGVAHLLSLGEYLRQAGRTDQALVHLTRAVALGPQVSDAWVNLGVAQQQTGDIDAARAAYRRAVDLGSERAQLYNNLGALEYQQNLPDAAEAYYRKAVALDPNLAEAHHHLAVLLSEGGQTREAMESFARVAEIYPSGMATINARLCLSPIVASRDDIATQRAVFAEGLRSLAQTPDTFANLSGLAGLYFYLAYHGLDDRPLLEAGGAIMAEPHRGLAATSPHIATWRPPAETGRRIRVGFLSDFFRAHTIGKLNVGFLEHLDRDRFEVVLIHGPLSQRDPYRDLLDDLSDRTLKLSGNSASHHTALSGLELDVLCYADIGMSLATYTLAVSRMAPVQFAMWGHPVTSGLPQIDYFYSSTRNEPPDATRHYSERLICSSRLPAYYAPPAEPKTILDRSGLGLPETGTLYACPQTLFKIHPDFDDIVSDIVKGDPEGWIIFIEGPTRLWSNMLKARWSRKNPTVLERTIFLDRLPFNKFLSLIKMVDVLLDPVHFGSGNSFYETMAFGTPVVTWPGAYARGRVVAGAYWQMGIEDAPIVARMEDYAALALALGKDPERRARLRHASVAAARRALFNDRAAVDELESFLTASVEAAGRGALLEVGWSPAALPDEEKREPIFRTNPTPNI